MDLFMGYQELLPDFLRLAARKSQSRQMGSIRNAMVAVHSPLTRYDGFGDERRRAATELAAHFMENFEDMNVGRGIMRTDAAGSGIVPSVSPRPGSSPRPTASA
jgi:hypothetical protein